MDNFIFYSPTLFAFGKERENETGSYVKRFGEVKYSLFTAAEAPLMHPRQSLQASFMTVIFGIFTVASTLRMRFR